MRASDAKSLWILVWVYMRTVGRFITSSAARLTSRDASRASHQRPAVGKLPTLALNPNMRLTPYFWVEHFLYAAPDFAHLANANDRDTDGTVCHRLNGGCNSWPAWIPPLWPGSWRRQVQEHPASEHSWESEWRLLVLFLLPLIYRLSFWRWWIKADWQPHTTKRQSRSPLYCEATFNSINPPHSLFTPPPPSATMNIRDSNLWRRVLRDTRSQVHPHQYQQKGGEKIKPSQNTYCWSALI